MIDLYKMIKPFNLFSKFERDRIKRYFKERIVWSPIYLFTVYLFMSYTDFLTNQDYNSIDMMIDYLWPSQWDKDVWDVDTFIHITCLTLGFAGLYFVSLMFVSLYHFTRKHWYLLTNFAVYILIDLNITYWDLFFYYMEKNWTAIGILYFIYFWVFVGLQWAVDMEEDVEFANEQEGIEEEIPEIWKEGDQIYNMLHYIIEGTVMQVPDSISTLKKRYEEHKIKVEHLKSKNKNIEPEEFVDKIGTNPKFYSDWEKSVIQTQKNIENAQDSIDNIWKFLYVSWFLIKELILGHFSIKAVFVYWFSSATFYIKFASYYIFIWLIEIPLFIYLAIVFVIHRIKISYYWTYFLVLAIISYFHTIYFFIKLLIVNLLGRNSRVYVVGPYSFYDPFFSRALFKNALEKKNSVKPKTWILGKRYYGVKNTSKWNVDQKRLSLKLFKKIETNIKK